MAASEQMVGRGTWANDVLSVETPSIDRSALGSMERVPRNESPLPGAPLGVAAAGRDDALAMWPSSSKMRRLVRSQSACAVDEIVFS